MLQLGTVQRALLIGQKKNGYWEWLEAQYSFLDKILEGYKKTISE